MKTPLYAMSYAISIVALSSVTLTGCATTHNSTLQDSTMPASIDAPQSYDMPVSVDAHPSHEPSAQVPHAKWSYNDPTGPNTWGDIEGFEACKLGHEQSPIDITTATLSDDALPVFNYTISNFNIVDNYHTVMFSPDTENNTLTVNGDTYILRQFHYHAPSEHHIAGVDFPVEIHFVHTNDEGDIAVVGVMLTPLNTDIGSESVLDKLLVDTKDIHKTHREGSVSDINVQSLIPSDTSFYRYQGSLTTPPCSERVQWYVAHTPLKVTANQVNVLKSLYQGINRPVQPVGERVVEYIE